MKIKSIISTILLAITLTTAAYAKEVKAFDQCSGTYKTYTSEMDKKIKVNESKLTSLNYVKKITKIERTEKFDDRKVYYLENGILIKQRGGNSICVLKIDDVVYGRAAVITNSGVVVSLNLHNDRVNSIDNVSTNGSWTRTTYLTSYGKAAYVQELQRQLNQKINIFIK